MGEVYRARDTRLDRHVAIKVLPEHLASDPEALARFEREAKAVAALSHPNIRAIHDFGSEQGVAYAVAELLEGETLRSRVARGPLPWRKAAEVGVALAEGLTAAHRKGITHRDLKPENVFLTSDGRVKILDFGLARWQPGSTGRGAPEAETEAGRVLGTVGYMAPEQVRGERATAPTDIFALGCVLYEMLSGTRAFSRPTPAETLAAILKEEPSPVATSGNQIPAELDRLLARCLEKNPEERSQSARDLGFALKDILGAPGVSPSAVPRKFRVRAYGAVGAVILLGAALLLYLRGFRDQAIDSLAVLPFVNVGADPDTEYLSDGITENLINSLSQLPRLRVVPRSTVFRYKGRDVDLQSVRRELHVRAVLTGRVVQRGDSLNIQSELVDVAADSQLWGRQFDRKFSDIIDVQEEIAKEVSEKLGLRPTDEEQKRLTRRYTENPEAHQLYLKGRYLWNRRTGKTLLRAAQYFQQAIEKDPGYALAWAGLGDCYVVYGFYDVMSNREAIPQAKEAALKALEIDDGLAEAHAVLAFAKRYDWDWDWPGTEKGFKRALELNPNYPTGHHWYGTTLWAMGRLDEGLTEVKRAQDLDPLSLIINADVARGFYFSRRYDQAEEQLRKTLEMDPGFPVAHWYLGMVYEQTGRYEEAIAEFQEFQNLSGDQPTAAGALGHAYAASGKRGEAQEVLLKLEDLSKSRYVAPFDVAAVYIGLGDEDRSLEWLEKAYEARSSWIIWVNVDPRFDNIRGDSRYQALLRRMRLPL